MPGPRHVKMAEIINLRRARKGKAKAEKEKTAEANRVAHGTPKHLRDLAKARRDVESTIEYLVGAMGRDAWEKGMNPDVPETKVTDNPYTYTDWDAGTGR